MEILVRDRISPEELDEKIKAIEAAERKRIQGMRKHKLGDHAVQQSIPTPETIADFNSSIVLGSE